MTSVCRLCLISDPENVSLLTHKCKCAESHGYPLDEVCVEWNKGKGILEEVKKTPVRTRPKPLIQLRPGSRFILCDRTRCHGQSCTYPHSVQERDEWNRELVQSGRINHAPNLSQESDSSWPSLSRTQSQIQPPQPAWRRTNMHFVSSHQQVKANHLHYEAHTVSSHQQVKEANYLHYEAHPVSSHQQVKEANHLHYEAHPVSSHQQVKEANHLHYEAHPVSSHQQVKEANHLHYEAHPVSSHQQVVERNHQGNVQAVISSLSSLSLQGPSAAVKAIPVSDIESMEMKNIRQRDSVASGNGQATAESQPQAFSSDDNPLYSPLSVNNYQSKFNQLIKAEEESHKGILRGRCNGSYRLSFAGFQCPKGIHAKNQFQYKLYAYIDGVSSDNLSYVNQASDSVTLTGHRSQIFTADIIYRQWQAKRLVVAFREDCRNSFQDKSNTKMIFNLKESYFKNLLDSVDSLNPVIISRIMPNSGSFLELKDVKEVKECVDYCSEEQFNALSVIMKSPSEGPPVLLSGAFGTGKSRLLALSARCMQLAKHTVRVLVCTQQRVSADRFFQYYLETWVGSKSGKVFVIREYALDKVDQKYIAYYRTSKDFQRTYRDENNIVVITTCLTAPHLHFLKPGYFSHILIDEGSQMREPEAVAPLQLAGKYTKIVIAGDENQVGPALLVLGDIPQKNGLALSLFQRLQLCYHDLGIANIATLSANYRCHRDILRLVGGLFYNNTLCWAANEQPPSTHPKYNYPLVFICSEINDTSGDNEADIVVRTAISIAKGVPTSWPKPPMPHIFIVSPCEEQVTLINEVLGRNRLPSKPNVQSSINIQGREFQVVLLSTTEPVNSDGSTRNPTRSLCDPYVFNTAVTRAKSLVVGVGNPFLLLKMEKQMVKSHGKRGNCWSTFLRSCLAHDTLELPHDQVLNKQAFIQKLEQCLEEVNPAIKSETKIKELEALVYELQNQQNQLSPSSPVHEFSPPSPMHHQLSPSSPMHHQLSPSSLMHHQLSPSSPMHHQLSPSSLMHHQLSPSSLMHHQLSPSSPMHHQLSPSSLMHHQLSPSAPDHSSSDVQRATPPQELTLQDLRQKVVKAPSDTELNGYERDHLLGSGGFGVVHCVTRKRDGEQYALKVIRLREDEGRLHANKWREVDALIDLKDSRIVEYVNSWVQVASTEWWCVKTNDGENQRCLIILMELCEKDTLKNWLLKHRGENSRNKKAMLDYFEQIVDALCFIHEKNYIHRDLKPSNIFFSSHKPEQLKVGDFGLVTFDEPLSVTSDSSGNMERPTTSSFRGGGTFPYISPEQLDHNRRSHVDAKTDMYSLGIILFDLHYPKEVEGDERSEVFSGVREGTFPPDFRARMSKIYDLIKSLTAIKPKRRPSATDVKKEQLVGLKKMNKKARKGYVPVL